MRTVIIDDEEKSRKTIKNFIAKYAPELMVLGEADGVETGIELIESIQPELVFLDVQMGDGTGFDLLGRLQFDDFKLIFCTSYEHYAVKAFRFSALDFILKPIDPDIFKSAIERVKKSNDNKSCRNVLAQNEKNLTQLALRSAEKITIINLNDIVRCESSINYTQFIMNDGSKMMVTKTLKEYDELLAPHGFIRIHKSHLVNMNAIVRYIKGDGGWIELTDGVKIEVSRRKKDILLEAIEKRVL
ncbi:MAG: response regulator transcription factor [Bacteroidales bacterium]|nr:response regulator transcription factor [Bacteroidales bacterium]